MQMSRVLSGVELFVDGNKFTQPQPQLRAEKAQQLASTSANTSIAPPAQDQPVIHALVLGAPKSDQFGLYRDSPKTEEVNIESTPLFGPVKFTTPPGRAWDRMANALVTSRLLDQLVQNPLWELRKTTHLIVYAISLER